MPVRIGQELKPVRLPQDVSRVFADDLQPRQRSGHERGGLVSDRPTMPAQCAAQRLARRLVVWMTPHGVRRLDRPAVVREKDRPAFGWSLFYRRRCPASASTKPTSAIRAHPAEADPVHAAPASGAFVVVIGAIQQHRPRVPEPAVLRVMRTADDVNVGRRRDARRDFDLQAVALNSSFEPLPVLDLVRLRRVDVNGNSHSSATSSGFGSPWKTHTAMSSGRFLPRQWYL